jgi:hypothetical protein
MVTRPSSSRASSAVGGAEQQLRLVVQGDAGKIRLPRLLAPIRNASGAVPTLIARPRARRR